MSRVNLLLTLAGAALLALGAAPKPVKQPPRPVPPVQTAYGQITQVDVAAGKLTLSARTFVAGAAKPSPQTFPISAGTPVIQGTLAQPKELRAGDKVIANYSSSPAVAMRHPYGDYPHLNAYGEVTKTSPLTIKVTGGMELVLSSANKAILQRQGKLNAKDLKQGWLVAVVSRKDGGRTVTDQVRVMGTFTMPAMTAPKPKPKAKP